MVVRRISSERERSISPRAHAGIHGDTRSRPCSTHTRARRSRTQHHSRTARARRPADDTWTQGQHSGHLPHGGCLSHQVCPDTGVIAGGGDVTACQPREAGQSWVLRQGGGRAGRRARPARAPRASGPRGGPLAADQPARRGGAGLILAVGVLEQRRVLGAPLAARPSDRRSS